MIHNANNSMETAVTSSSNSINCLNQMVASVPTPVSTVPVAGTVASSAGGSGGGGGSSVVGNSSSIIASAATVANNNNNNNNNSNPSHLIEEIATENFWLREKMKEINADRDRLLCEVANLRLELDMAELKRLPEDR